MSDVFDPEVFMNQTIDSPMSIDWELPPEGYFQAMVDDFDTSEKFFRRGSSDKGPWVIFNCPFSILDPAVLAKLGRDKVVVRGGWFLEFDGAALSTDKSKNVMIGRLRNALGQNSGTWSLPMLKGAGPVMVQVKHRADKNDPEKKYAEVVNVAPVR